MKLSIFLMITKPEQRGDPWRESIANFTNFADEVVIVCGDKSDLYLNYPNKEKIRLVYNKWRPNDYMMYGEQYKLGFEATTGDYAIRCDVDYFFHEDDWEDIRICLEASDQSVLFMSKKQFVLTDRYRIKAMMPIVFRGNMRGKITFDGGGDYTWPRIDGVMISDKSKAVCRKEYVIIADNVTDKQLRDRLPDAIERDGQMVQMNRRISVYNFDMCFKDKKTIAREFLKQSRARFKKTGNDWGQTEEKALDYFMRMQVGRLNAEGWAKAETHPKHIMEKVKNIKPDQLGYNVFGQYKEERKR